VSSPYPVLPINQRLHLASLQALLLKTPVDFSHWPIKRPSNFVIVTCKFDTPQKPLLLFFLQTQASILVFAPLQFCLLGRSFGLEVAILLSESEFWAIDYSIHNNASTGRKDRGGSALGSWLFLMRFVEVAWWWMLLKAWPEMAVLSLLWIFTQIEFGKFGSNQTRIL
jgi:hypothetical protein